NAKADERGHYRHVVTEKAPHDFEAGDPAGKLAAAVARSVAPGTRDLVLRLAEPRLLRVRVRADRGAGPAYLASTCDRESDWTVLSGPLRGPHEDGLAQVAIPAVSFRVKIDAPGHRLALQGPFEPDAAPESVDVVLERVPGVRGRVRSGGREVS